MSIGRDVYPVGSLQSIYYQFMIRHFKVATGMRISDGQEEKGNLCSGLRTRLIFVTSDRFG